MSDRDDETTRLVAELAAERAYFRSELERGAAELAERDEVVARLRARQRRLTAQRDRARARLAVYEGSRTLRLAARVLQRVRRRGAA